MTVELRSIGATDRPRRIRRAVAAGAALIGGAALLLIAPASAQAAPLPPATMNVVCDPSIVVTGNPTTCTVTVSSVFGAATPTGVITIPSDTGLGLFSPPSCRLVSRVGSHTASCTFVYRPLGPGSNTRTDVITFAYSGDANYPATSTTVSEGVAAKQGTFSVLGCSDGFNGGPFGGPIVAGQTASCSAYITSNLPVGENGTVPRPSGTITLSGASGQIAPATCTLTTIPAPTFLGGSPFQGCTFSYTPQGVGSPTRTDAITVTYPGDSWYSPSTTNTSVPVVAP